MRYVLNSAVITAPGLYEYKLINSEQAALWLCAGDFVSTIGYEETAEALLAISGVAVAVNRRMITMAPGDTALVFRLTLAPGSVRLAVESKGHLTLDFVKEHCEIGILTKLE